MAEALLDSHVKITPKDDPKDRIEVEIGDSKQPDFKPQVKLMRWDNEVNASFRLIDSSFDGIVPVVDGDKTKLVNGKKEIHFYNIAPNKKHPEGSYEVEIILKEKPTSNVSEFSIRTKGLDFFYQSELTQQEKDEVVFRPENVIGSYAVYHKTKGGMNRSDGMEFKTGKAFHIYRPKVIDANGNEIWGELNVDEQSELLTITINQTWLDSAVYPVVVDPTFGFTEIGATTSSSSSKTGSIYSCPAVGTLSKITVYGVVTTEQDNSGAVYEDDSGTPGNLLVATDNPVFTINANAWRDIPLVADVSIAAYWLLTWIEGLSSFIYHFDSGSTNQRVFQSGGTWDTWPNPYGTPGGFANRKVSIYATFTEGGGDVVKDLVGGGIIPFPR